MMEEARKIVVFPGGQFFAVVGKLRMPQNPYLLSLPDILNEQSSATHRARNHEHRSGRIFLSDVEFYALHDPCTRVCGDLTRCHVQVGDISAAIDFYPEKYQGNDDKRRDYAQRQIRTEVLHFVQHHQVFSGLVDAMEVYRKSEGFVSVNKLQTLPATREGEGPIAEFLGRIRCPQPRFMAVNLARVLHS